MNFELFFTCEHASFSLPEAWVGLFAGDEAVLESHRGWDAGARALAQSCAKTLDIALFCGRHSRLLVDLNRSLDNPDLWSDWTRGLDGESHAQLVAAYWKPFRAAVRQQVCRAVELTGGCLHISVHSFTPELKGERRKTDIGILFDPERARERALAERMLAELRGATDFVIDDNKPYHGTADGHTTALRREFPDAAYAGIEWEINQRLIGRDGRFPEKLCRKLARVAQSTASVST